MILKLHKQKISIKPMAVPENTQHIHVQYEYEHNTKHLKPILRYEGYTYEGHTPVISIDTFKHHTYVTVELVDGLGIVVRQYSSIIPQHHYVVWGDKPIKPDLEAYIYALEKEVEALRNEGEVI
jgi:hypothetical protein